MSEIERKNYLIDKRVEEELIGVEDESIKKAIEEGAKERKKAYNELDAYLKENKPKRPNLFKERIKKEAGIDENFQLNTDEINSLINDLSEPSYVPYNGQARYKELIADAKEVLKAATAFEQDKKNVASKRLFDEKYARFYKDVAKFNRQSKYEKDVRQAEFSPEGEEILKERQDKINHILELFNPALPLGEERNDYIENAEESEKEITDSEREIRKEKDTRVQQYEELCKHVDGVKFNSAEVGSGFSILKKNLKELAKLEKDFGTVAPFLRPEKDSNDAFKPEPMTKAERQAKYKTILMIENRLKKDAEAYTESLREKIKNSSSDAQKRACMRAISFVDCIKADINERMLAENRELQRMAPAKKNQDSEDKELDYYAKVQEKIDGLKPAGKENLVVVKDDIFNFEGEDDDFELDENEKSLLGVDEKLLKSNIYDMMEDKYYGLNNAEKQDKLQKDILAAKAKENSKVIPEYEFKVDDIQTDMVEMLKLGEKNVYFGTNEYKQLITCAEKFAEAKKNYESKLPELDKKAYKSMLQWGTGLNKRMDTYIERKKKEIQTDIDKGKVPNFNSVKRCELVKNLRDELVKIRDKDIQRHPETSLNIQMEAQRVIREDKKHPLSYEAYRKSVFSSLYLKQLKENYDATKSTKRTGVQKQALEKLGEGLTSSKYRKAVGAMESAVEGTDFDKYLKTYIKYQGGQVFNAVNVDKEAVDSLKSTINKMHENLDDYETAAKYDNFIGVIKMLGFSKVLKKENVDMRSSDKILSENAKNASRNSSFSI